MQSPCPGMAVVYHLFNPDLRRPRALAALAAAPDPGCSRGDYDYYDYLSHLGGDLSWERTIGPSQRQRRS